MTVSQAPVPTGTRSRPPRRTRQRLTRALSIVEARDAAARRNALNRRLLAVGDVLAALVALSVSGAWRAGPVVLVVPPLVVLANKLAGLYDRDELLLRKSTLEEVPKLFALATIIALGFYLLGEELGEPLAPSSLAALWLALCASFVLARWGVRRLSARLTPPERCLVIGERERTEVVRAKLRTARELEVVGVVPLDDGERVGALADPRDLSALVRHLDVHRLVLAPRNESDTLLDTVRTAKAAGVTVSVLPRLFEVIGSSAEFDELDGMRVLGVRRFGLSRSSRIVKRAFDLLGAGVLLIVLGPVLLAIALAIRLDSRGPVFFRQVRVGHHDRRFRIFKFRTMVHDAEARKSELQDRNEGADGFFKIARDPRITRVGGLLRKTSLDELPQLLNVLSGDMSLVGPRPLIPEEDGLLEGWRRRRLHLKPGMTGPWQILGSSRIPLREMVNIDYLYVANWSLWEDLKILLRTIPCVVSRRGL
jgi:exopolysaccharide biosynthesis polyprenyl glycosylphosphotransferase